MASRQKRQTRASEKSTYQITCDVNNANACVTALVKVGNENALCFRFTYHSDYLAQVHTALVAHDGRGLGLDNTWVRDVNIVLPTFTAAIDDVTMAFAERLQVAVQIRLGLDPSNSVPGLDFIFRLMAPLRN